MAVTKLKRILFVVLGGFFLATFLLLLVFPVWFPWILRPLSSKFGVHYAAYHGVGHGKFALSGVAYTDEATRFKADRIEAFLPTTWLWRHYVGRAGAESAFVKVSGWEWAFLKNPAESTGKNQLPRSAHEVVKNVEKTLRTLQPWLPAAVLDEGIIRYGEKKVHLASVIWKSGAISCRIFMDHGQTCLLTAKLASAGFWEILVNIEPTGLDAKVFVTENAASIRIQSTALWQSNRIDAAAQFGEEGWLPERASLRAESVCVPAAELKLKGYSDLTGSLSLEWRQDRFTLDVAGQGQSNGEEGTALPPIEVILQASGDTRSVHVSVAKVSSPWLNASLSKEVEVSFQGQLLSDAVTLQLSADLAKQSWVPATGALHGKAVIRPGAKKYPDLDFDLAGEEIGGFGLRARTVVLKGNLGWPWLQLNRTEIQFADGSQAQAEAEINVETGSVAGGGFKLNGSIGQNLLPAGYSYRDLSLSGEFSGPFRELKHAGQLEIHELDVPQLVPITIAAHWQGKHLDLESFSAKLSSGKASLVMEGSGQMRKEQISFLLKTLDLNRANEASLTLAKPCDILLQKPRRNGKSSATDWLVRVEQFSWRGKESELLLQGEVDWPYRGALQSSARSLPLSLMQDFVSQPLPSFNVEQLALSGAWTNGPLYFKLGLISQFTFPEGASVSASVTTTGDASGLLLSQVTLTGQSGRVISGEGFLPVSIVPGHRSGPFQITTNKLIDFRATTEPNKVVWEQIGSWTGITLGDPHLNLAVSGTLDSPQGHLALQVEKIESRHPEQKLPALKNIEANVDFTRDKVRLTQLNMKVQGQPIFASGEIPLSSDFRSDWRHLLQWEKGTARLKVENVEVSAFAKFFPTILSPQGRVNLNLAVLPGIQLEGELLIDSAATRPLPPLGPLHDVRGKLVFNKRRIEIEKLSGSLGGEPLTLSGRIELAEAKARNGLPLIDLAIRGKNLPLVRQSELILRSDLDLSVSNVTNNPVAVSGSVNLRESFYLSDLKPLIPGKVAKPDRRPPYFSLDLEPWADWALNVKVTGDHFLKVRSPFFRGEVSAHLNLGGTLKEPIALGQATIDAGLIQFPFGSLRVVQGLVTLSSDNPYQPGLFVTASSRSFGYEIKMEARGSADNPIIEFSSTPPLSSEQIVLILTAGELPRNEITFSNQQRAARVGLFLGKSLLSKLGTGAGEDRLTVRSGDEISQAGKETYYLEYKLSDDWSLVGEYDRFNDFNAGVKWRIYSR